MNETHRPSERPAFRTATPMNAIEAMVFLILLATAIPIVMTIWALSIWLARLVW